jgi:acetyl-CoA hydrolase
MSEPQKEDQKDRPAFKDHERRGHHRGLSPQERARTIITNCVHPDYKSLMQEYYERAKRECCAANMGHEPHMLFKVFKMQQNLAENGTMKIANWN